MLKIILLGAAAVGVALFVDAYAANPNLAQAASPYAGPAPSMRRPRGKAARPISIPRRAPPRSRSANKRFARRIG